MRILLLNIVILLLASIGCKSEKESKLNEIPHTEKVEINIEYSSIYLSPKAKPIIDNWEAYIDLQNKVYELKNTDTLKLKKQLEHLEILIDELLASDIPEKLKTHLFERKIELLKKSVIDLKILLSNEIFFTKDIEKGVHKILRNYAASKNQINAIYGG